MRRFTLFVVLALAVVAATTNPAAAHAELRSTDPVNGAVLSTPPRRIALEFTADVEDALASIRVVDGAGREVEVGPARHLDGASRLVAVDVPSLSPGSYAVAWRVVSADAHPLQGTFVFQVAGSTPPPTARAPAQPPPDNRVIARQLLEADDDGSVVGALYGIARFAAFAGLLLLAGAGMFVLALWPVGLRVARVRRLVIGAWLLTLLSTVAVLGLQGAYAGSRPLADAVDPSVIDATLDTRFGVAMLFRLVLLAAGAFVLWLLLRSKREQRPWPVVACAAVLGFWLLATPGMAGHAAASERPALTMVSDVVHLAAAAFWLGGLGVLVVAMLRGPAVEELDAVVPRFSRLAFVAVVLILATGSLQGWQQLESVDALTQTTYGRLLIVKVGVFAAMVAVAGLSRRWVRMRYRAPHAAPAVGASALLPVRIATLRRSVAAEALGGAVVLALTALLVNAVPGRTALALPFATTLETRGVVVDVTIDPAKAGPTAVHVYTLERVGAVKDVQAITGTLSPPDGGAPIVVPLRRAGPGHYSAYAVEIPVPGRWRLDVTVRVSDSEEVRGRATIPVR